MCQVQIANRENRHSSCSLLQVRPVTLRLILTLSDISRDCFFHLISLRFRRTLEPHINPNPQQHRRKGLKASGNLLIGLSGGLGSSILLDLVQKTYLSLRERQQGDQNPNGVACPWSKVFVAYVDISGVIPGVRDIRTMKTICLTTYSLLRPKIKVRSSSNMSTDSAQKSNTYL